MAPDLRARVILLAGPSGSGKSYLARSSGLSVLSLDDFYKDGTDPTLPRSAALGIADWDDPTAWDAQRAVDTVELVCRRGCATVPVYDIAQDRTVGTRDFRVDTASAFVAEGLFVAEVVGACRERGILADAFVIRRAPWKNYARRLTRDLVERRKPPVTLLRRGAQLMRDEQAVVARQVAQGCLPRTAAQVRAALSSYTGA